MVSPDPRMDFSELVMFELAVFQAPDEVLLGGAVQGSDIGTVQDRGREMERQISQAQEY